MALQSNIGLHQSRLTHPVRDITHSYVLLHNIGYSLEDSVSQADFISLLVWPAEGKKKKNCKTPRRNVKCRTSSPMFILYSVPIYFIHSKADCHRLDWRFEGRNPLRLRPIPPCLSANTDISRAKTHDATALSRLTALNPIPGTLATFTDLMN